MLSNWNPSRIYYGWWIVGASVLVAMYAGGVVFYGFTAIFEPIANDMGWSYAQISLAASLRGLELGLLAPLTGILTDRLGPRRLIFSGAIITAVGLFLLSRTTSLAMFYGAFALIAVGMSATTLTVLMTAIANWFRLRVSIASGIANSGFGLAGLLVPVIVKLLEIYDWRMT
ncbi:MAG: MFS transporter, partial [Anaerolineales bacterium]|nr:MFS transporter [Anaerolineales bacterium]